MSAISGALLWNRVRFGTVAHPALPVGDTDVDTGLCQVIKGLVDPPLGIVGTGSPADGALPASRVQVLPQSPLSSWVDVTHGEPYFNSVTNTVHVRFTFNGKGTTSPNVLFLDPHTLIGPGQADTYNAGG